MKCKNRFETKDADCKISKSYVVVKHDKHDLQLKLFQKISTI